MLANVTLLLLCQLAGETAVRFLGLPLPGPVVGMVFLFVGLIVKGGIPEGLDATARTLLGNLALLFVPASVGVMVHLRTIAAEVIPISVAVVASTLLTIAVTGRLMQRLTKDRRKDDP